MKAIYFTVLMLIISLPTFATKPVPESAFFVGLGGSYNSIDLKQKFSATGVASLYSTPAPSDLLAAGTATGSTHNFYANQSTLAPEIQIGYFNHFSNSKWLWGAKYFYQYLGDTLTQDEFLIPQAGTIADGEYAGEPMTGNVLVGSAQTSINHEMALLIFIGHEYKFGQAYLGAGPSLFGTESRLYDLTGFADLNGQHVDMTGLPDNFSSSEWVWGGIVQVGLTYTFDPTWFLDFNYSYAFTGNFNEKYSAPFASTPSDSSAASGMAYVETKQRLNTQTIGITLNKWF